MYVVAGFCPTPYVVHHRRGNYYLPKKISEISNSGTICLQKIVFLSFCFPRFYLGNLLFPPKTPDFPPSHNHFHSAQYFIFERKFLSHSTVCKVDSLRTGADEGLRPGTFQSSSLTHLLISTRDLPLHCPPLCKSRRTASTLKISVALINTHKPVVHFLQACFLKST